MLVFNFFAVVLHLQNCDFSQFSQRYFHVAYANDYVNADDDHDDDVDDKDDNDRDDDDDDDVDGKNNDDDRDKSSKFHKDEMK